MDPTLDLAQNISQSSLEEGLPLLVNKYSSDFTTEKE